MSWCSPCSCLNFNVPSNKAGHCTNVRIFQDGLSYAKITAPPFFKFHMPSKQAKKVEVYWCYPHRGPKVTEWLRSLLLVTEAGDKEGARHAHWSLQLLPRRDLLPLTFHGPRHVHDQIQPQTGREIQFYPASGRRKTGNICKQV